MDKSATECVRRDLELYKIDLCATKKQLESKTEAVSILWRMLDKCEKERSEFKIMAEQVMNRYQILKRTLCHSSPFNGSTEDELYHLPSRQLASLLTESRQANKSLQCELVDLTNKLSEAIGDNNVLRKQLLEYSARYSSCENPSKLSTEELILQVEQLSLELNDCHRELVRCHDEKQELVAERDTYQNKCDRLHNELVYILNGNERKLVDIDLLITEKRDLTAKVEAIEEEKNLALAALRKYNGLLHRKSASRPSTTSSDSNECSSSDCVWPSHPDGTNKNVGTASASTTEVVGSNDEH